MDGDAEQPPLQPPFVSTIVFHFIRETRARLVPGHSVIAWWLTTSNERALQPVRTAGLSRSSTVKGVCET
jgi:hypothetical protein